MLVCLWQRTGADEVEANDPPLQMSHKTFANRSNGGPSKTNKEPPAARY